MQQRPFLFLLFTTSPCTFSLDLAKSRLLKHGSCERTPSAPVPSVLLTYPVLSAVPLSPIAGAAYDSCCMQTKPGIALGEQTIITFYNCTQKAIADSPIEAKVTWAHIKTTMAPLLQKVRTCIIRRCPRTFSPACTRMRKTFRGRFLFVFCSFFFRLFVFVSVFFVSRK